MLTIVKLGLTKAVISSTFQTNVRYGLLYLDNIGLFLYILIQVTGRIAFLIEHFWKLTLSCPILRANLYIIQLELGRRGRILEEGQPKTQQWLQTESWIREVWEFMSDYHINIYYLVTDVSAQLTYDVCLMIHLALNGEFTTSELPAINRCCLSKVILFLSKICNHQGNHRLKSAVDNDTSFSLLYDSNWPRKHHRSLESWRTWRKALQNLCNDSKVKLCAPSGKW